MNDTTETPEHWTEVDVEQLPEEYPDGVTENDGPFLWKNDNTDRRIWLEPNVDPQIEEFDDWLVTGENSIVTSEGSLSDARDAAYRFMENNTHPSSMI